MSTTHTLGKTKYGRPTITIGEHRLVLVPRDHTRDDRVVWSKGRLYGAVDVLGGEANEALEANAARPVSPHGIDDFRTQDERDAHMREYRSLRRQVIKTVKAQLTDIFARFTAAGVIGLTIEKMTFSIKAGCTTCACSPGFIFNGPVTYNNQPVDVYLESVR
jgi:hypothetical protein